MQCIMHNNLVSIISIQYDNKLTFTGDLQMDQILFRILPASVLAAGGKCPDKAIGAQQHPQGRGAGKGDLEVDPGPSLQSQRYSGPADPLPPPSLCVLEK